jgi:hypothetical protein
MKKIRGILIAMVVLCSCYNRNETNLYPSPATCDTSVVTFSGTILPIMQEHCAISGCHTGPSTGNGLNYNLYSGLAVVASNGQLIPAIEHTGPDPMPKDMPMLDACSINEIVRWVNEGYPDN